MRRSIPSIHGAMIAKRSAFNIVLRGEGKENHSGWIDKEKEKSFCSRPTKGKKTFRGDMTTKEIFSKKKKKKKKNSLTPRWAYKEEA